MTGLRRLDAFVKPRHDLRTRTALGGIITLVAATAAALLFVSEIFIYLRGATRHSLHLSESIAVPLHRQSSHHHDGTIPLKFMITFPHLQCRQLDFALDDASHSTGMLEKVYGRQSLTLRTPTFSELKKATNGATPALTRHGCNMSADLKIALVAGDFAITITRRTWAEATSTLLLGLLDDRQVPSEMQPKKLEFNVSHYIHYIRFGTPFPLAAASPLESRLHEIQNNMGGIALQQMHVKLIPTLYQRSFLSTLQTYQLSVVDHTVQPETLVAKGVPLLPGISVSYDFTPLAVHHIESRENIITFLCSLISIVGGVFVTVGLVTGCLVHSAAAVAKKLD